MNIKSLLLGSAAAFVAVSGARAADAVVIAEPEPMEYVRICDTYGVGFYYIPGTETCLKFSGYIRYDIGIGSLGFEDAYSKEDVYRNVIDGDLGDGDADTNDTYDKRARFALRVDARQETEMGTLRGFAQVNFNYDVGAFGEDIDNVDGVWTYQDGTNIDLNHAYIELGGFRIGKTDSLFTTFTGYASGVSNDGLVPYGPFDTHQIAYTFTGGNGFTAAVALENGGGGEDRWDFDQFGALSGLSDLYTIDSYVPHVVGGVGWTGGWGGVSLVAGYDSVWEEGAIKGRIDFNVGDAISLFVMAAYGTGDSDFIDDGIGADVPDWDDSPNYYAPWGGQWAAWFGGAWKFTEAATFNFEVGYDDFEDFSVVANVDYELVPGLHIIPEIAYYDAGDQIVIDSFTLDGPVYGVEDQDEEWGGFLRVQYNWGG